MSSEELIFEVVIPISQSAEFVVEMDFYRSFQSHFLSVYGLELFVRETSEDTCEIVFKGIESAIEIVIGVLQEMGLSPIFMTDSDKPTLSKDIDDPKKYH